MDNKLERKTKDELLEIIKSQTETVRSKDKDIRELQHILEREQNKRDPQVASKEDLLAKQKEHYEEQIKKIKEEQQDRLTRIQEYIKRREAEMNELLSAYGDLLKSLQGITDMGVRYNTYIYKRITTQKDEK